MVCFWIWWLSVVFFHIDLYICRYLFSVVCYKPNLGSRLPAAVNTQIAHIRGVVSPHKTHWHNLGIITREQAFISEAAPYLIPTYVQCSEYAIPAADDRWSSPEQQPRSLLSPQPPQCLLSPSADLIAGTYWCNCTDYQYKRVKVKPARWETQATQPLQSFLSLADLANAFKQKSNW